MAEPSAADLRRLQALEGRLAKASDERERLAAERRELRAAATESGRRIRELEKEAGATRKTLDALLGENASLAARLEESSADAKRIQAASLELRTQLDAARTELGESAKAVAQVQAEVAALRKERDGLAESLALAKEQLAGKAVSPVLTAKEVSSLVDDLIADLGESLPGMAVRDGELQLTVGFEKVGRATGFIVPSSESPPEMREGLHQISVRFDRAAEPPER